MKSKPSKNRHGRAPSAAHRRWTAWVAEQDCVTCGNPGPSIVHHPKGAKYPHNKLTIGHWLALPQCGICDEYATSGNHTIWAKQFGPAIIYWRELFSRYPRKSECPQEIIEAIKDWGEYDIRRL